MSVRRLQHMKLPLKSIKPINPDAIEHNMKRSARHQYTCSVTSSADNIDNIQWIRVNSLRDQNVLFARSSEICCKYLCLENRPFYLVNVIHTSCFSCNKQNKQQANKSQELYTNINIFIKIIDLSSSYPSYSQAVVSV